MITNPEWARRPSAELILRFVPPLAHDMMVSGRATIECAVMADGKLADCFVVSESPAGWGYGEAVLKVSRHFVLQPRTVDGEPVSGARVRVPVRFMMTAETPLICKDAPATQRTCVHDPADDDPMNIRRGAVQMALEWARNREPTESERRAIESGGFRWIVALEMPVEDCPAFDGRAVCGGPAAVPH